VPGGYRQLVRFSHARVNVAVCQTSVVAYHEAFWVVTGTAAPVIALAAILSVGESATVGRNLGRFIWNAKRHPDRYRDNNEDDTAWDQRLGTAHTARTYSMLKYLAAERNLASQAALLAMSLVSIDGADNSVPPWLAIVLAVGGIVLLLVVSRWSAGVVSYWKEVVEPDRPERQTPHPHEFGSPFRRPES